MSLSPGFCAAHDRRLSQRDVRQRGDHDSARALAKGIERVLVIDLENENFSTTFGPNSLAVYLNQTLLRQGQLVVNYFATSHVSLGNYISQVGFMVISGRCSRRRAR
jgi:hypothetical protein